MRTIADYLGAAGLCASTVLGSAAHADTATSSATATDNATTPDNDGDENVEVVRVTGVRSLLRDKMGDTELTTPQSVTVISSEQIGRAHV